MKTVTVLETAKELLAVSPRNCEAGKCTSGLPEGATLIFSNGMTCVQLQKVGCPFFTLEGVTAEDVLVALAENAGFSVRINDGIRTRVLKSELQRHRYEIPNDVV